MKFITLMFVITLCASLLGLSILTHAVTDVLVAHWAFDDGTGNTASDASGNGHDGTLIGDPQWTDGYFGGALEFDQEQDEVNVPYHADLNPETFTICAWANVDPDTTVHRAIVSSRDDFPQRGYVLYAEPNPNNTWLVLVGAGSGWGHIRGPEVNNGDWEHIAGVYADGKIKFYVNGEFVEEKDSALSVNTAQELLIGAGANETPNHNYFFKGKIDEVQLYNRELSEVEIASVMETQVTAVEASDKLAITWASLKTR